MGRFQFASNICWKCTDAVVHFKGDYCTECGAPVKRPVAHIFLLLALFWGLICLLPTVAQSAEPTPLVLPSRLVIPEEFQSPDPSPASTQGPLQPIPKLELIVPVGEVASALACPLDASVLVNAMEGQSTFVCSGTVVDSSNGISTILTCAHEFRGLKSPTITVIHQKKEYPAKLLSKSDANDLAVVEVKASLPAVELAVEKPKVGDRVTSIGLSNANAGSLEETSHRVTAVDKYDQPRNFETDGSESLGRSGGGLFFNGALCGIVQGRRNDVRRSLYVAIEPIREILTKASIPCQSCAIEQYGSVGSRRLVKAYSLDRCVRCKQEREEKGEGSLATKIDWTDDKIPEWILRKLPRGYEAPVYVWERGDGLFQWPASSHGVSMDMLDKWTEDSNATYEPAATGVEVVGSQQVGASINGRAYIEQAFDFIDHNAGTECEATFAWHREGGLDALPVGKSVSLQEFAGTSGSIELTVTTTKKLPIHAIKFDYKFENGKFFVRAPDWIEVQLPEDGTVGATSKPVGSVVLAYTILSVAYNVYAALHPTADVYLGQDVSMSAKYVNRVLTVGGGQKPIAVRLHWAFMMGLLRFEMSRPLTGLVANTQNVQLQFHRSRLFRDVNLEVK